MNVLEFIRVFHEKMRSLPDSGQRLREFTEILGTKVYSHIHGNLTAQERNLIYEEYQTWALFTFLNEIESYSCSHKSNSLLDQISLLYQTDRSFLCTLLLMEWVEKTKRVGVVYHETYSLIPTNTYNSLVTKSSKIYSLDPDSMLRNSQVQDQSDVNTASKILIDCFWLARSGDLKKAQEVLINSQASWQALSIGGLLPYFDFTTYEFTREQMIPSVMNTLEKEMRCEASERESDFYGEMGNCNLELYIATCWNISRKSKITSEKALYGSLCGNYEAMLEMCEGDIYDHFWALVRTQYIFQLRQKVKDTEESFQPVERVNENDCNDLGVPVRIPNHWPSSFEGILRAIQQKYAGQFRNPFIKLQFHCIAQAVLGKWEGVIDNILEFGHRNHEASEEGNLVKITYLRFAAHLLTVYSENFKVNTDRRKSFEGIIKKYLEILIENRIELDSILFYMRYLTESAIIRPLFTSIFLIFKGEAQYKKCAFTLQTYAQQDYQGILSQIIIDISDLKELHILPNNVLNTLKNHNTSDSGIEDLLKNMYDPVTRDSLPSVLILIRKLVISCKINLALSLWTKCSMSPKNSLQELELDYWGSFLNACKLYITYTECRSFNYLEEIEKNSVKIVPSSLITPHKLENNPMIALGQINEKCRQLAERLEPLLVDVTGIIIKDFPLQSIQFLEILRFKENWWWILLLWLSEIYLELNKYSEAESLLALLESVFLNKIVEDQRAFLVKKIKEVISKIRNQS